MALEPGLEQYLEPASPLQPRQQLQLRLPSMVLQEQAWEGWCPELGAWCQGLEV